MEIKIKRPLVPNFIRCHEGTFPLDEMNENEIKKYLAYFESELWQRRSQMQEEKNGRN